MIKTTVSDIHLGYRCPRLLGYKLKGRTEAWRVGLDGTGLFQGKLFHNQIARPFHAILSSGQKTPLSKRLTRLLSQSDPWSAEEIIEILSDTIFVPLLKKKGQHLTVAQVESLIHGVGAWSRFLFDFLQKHIDVKQGYPALETLFCDPEKKLTHTFKIKGGDQITVTGIYDTVLMDVSAGEAVVVELKGLKAGNRDEDLIQAAIYAMLIRLESGLNPRVEVLYLEEDDPAISYTAEDIKGLESNVISLLNDIAHIICEAAKDKAAELPPPREEKLCEECPFDQICDKDWGTRRIMIESVDKDDEKQEANRLTDLLISTLNVLKLPVKSAGFIIGPRLIRLKIKPEIKRGTTVKKITNRAEDIQIALTLNSPPLMQAQAGYLSVDVPRKYTAPLTLSQLREKGIYEKPESCAAFPIGLGVDGTVTWADLTSPLMTSILIAGTTGSGKSIFLRSAVINMALQASPEEVTFTLIDPKRVTFTDLAELPHLRTPVIVDLEPAMACLATLVEEMEERYRLFESKSVMDISQYNIGRKPLPHHVVLIDEYADLMIDKESKKDAEIYIQRLSQKGRAAGFHLLLATQRPDAGVVTPLIKANLQLKIALKVTTASNSQIILDESGAERLMGNGDMLVGGAISLIRLQGAIPTGTDIKSALRQPQKC